MCKITPNAVPEDNLKLSKPAIVVNVCKGYVRNICVRDGGGAWYGATAGGTDTLFWTWGLKKNALGSASDACLPPSLGTRTRFGWVQAVRGPSLGLDLARVPGPP